MRRSRSLTYVLVGTILVSAMPASASLRDRYQCEATHVTSAGWDYKKSQFVTTAGTHSPGNRLMLTDVDGKVPVLVGNQGTGKLHVVSRSETELQMVEVTPAGTVVTWALFDSDRNMNLKNAVLVATKTYDMFGPASFTTVYRCDPTDSSLR
jgi:hypothetical protein